MVQVALEMSRRAPHASRLVTCWRNAACFVVPLLLGALAATPAARAAEPASPLREEALRALRRGVEFFRKEVAVEGTYLWQYSEDLSKREGEGKATTTQGWVQPPGTPSVGRAFLAAFDATGEAAFLDAARATAHGLVRGQLRSGGWTYSIDFAPAARAKVAYRDGGQPAARNVTTLDDDTTPAALRFLLRADRALRFQDARVHEAVRCALAALLQAQYPNGAWPQGYDAFPEPDKFPVKKAAYPESWSRVWPGSGQYWRRYTLNDGVLANMIDTLLEAAALCGEASAPADLRPYAARCRAAAEKAGEFLILAQMPEPQPAWAQQYDFDMHPAWARKFEPPAVTGGESQGALRALLVLYRATGQRRFLEPVPRALAYLRRARLPDGRLARFHELRTNQPLYFTRDYRLTYDDGDLPTHYAFKVADGTDAIAREFERVQALKPEELKPDAPRRPAKADAALLAEVKRVLAAQDARGRWVEDGRLRHHGQNDPTTRVLRSATFSRNVETLSRLLACEP
jgi:hypothetical protein